MDNAWTVREEGVKKTKVWSIQKQQIGQFFKSEWVIGKLIPKCIEFINKEKLGYLHRLAAFNTLKVSEK